MNRLFSSASYSALLAASALLFAPLPIGSTAARADSFTVGAGATQTEPQSVSGTDTGLIEAGGTLETDGDDAIVWDGPATGPTGIVITNDGTISTTDRAIDTDDEVSGNFTLRNNGLIESDDDTLRIDDAFAGGSLHVVNTGEMTSGEGQVLDLTNANDASARVRIENSGSITAEENDAIRLGGGTIAIDNSGTIEAQDGNKAIVFDEAENVETLNSFTLVNRAGGQIFGEDDAFKVNAEEGSTSAARFDITNHGTIDGGDGEALDFDELASPNAVVTISNTGTLQSQDSDAVRFSGGSILLTNSGTIQTFNEDDRALKFDAEANIENVSSFTLINEEGGQIIGGDDAFKIAADADNNASSAVISIENHGLIDGGIGQALDFADLTSATNQITIRNYGTLQSSEADGIRPGAFANVINYGVIQSTDLTSDGDGVDFQGAGGSVLNASGGQILGAKHGITGDGATTVYNEAGGLIAGRNGSGINVDSLEGVVVNVTNYGTIQGAVTGLLDDDGDPDGVPDGDGDGVDVDGQVMLYNYGLIQGTGATGTNDGDPNTADGIAAGGGLIYNATSGTIQAFDNYANDGQDNVGRAILIDDSSQGAAPFATTLINDGLITSDGVAVTFIGDNDDVIKNAGTISSGNAMAVDMGGGDDVFVRYAYGTVIGYVTAGSGYDTLEFAEQTDLVHYVDNFDLGLLGNTAQYRDFERLLIHQGAFVSATGSSDFAGAVVVEDGTLFLHGAMPSASLTLANSLGFLGGNGTLGSLTVGPGTVSPGNSIGTITVNGTVTFNAGSTYVVEFNQTSSDQIIAGTSAINGGSVLLYSEGGPLNVGAVYNIVSAGATTTPNGQFDRVSMGQNFLFIDPTLGRDGGSVTLTLERNGVSFASLGRTANQQAVGGGIDLANGGLLQSTVFAATEGQQSAIVSGYDLLSGEVHASVGSTLFYQSTLVADTLVGRLRQASAISASPAMAALAAGGPVTAYAAKAPAPQSPFPVKAAPIEPAGPVYATWAQGFGQWSTTDGNGNAAEVDSSLGGFLAGGDVTTGNVTFGLAAGYASASTDVDDRLSSADSDTVLIAAYAGTSFDAFRLRGGASYGWSNIDTERTAAMLGIVENPLGAYDGSTANIFVEAAYAFETASIAFEPFAQIAWSWIETDSFVETNAPNLGLASPGLSYDVPYSTLGLRLATSFAVGAGTVAPHATLGWRHAYGDLAPDIAMSFAETGGAFTVAGAPIAQDSFVLGAGVDFNIGQNLSLNIGYEGQFASEIETNAIKGGLTYRF